MKTVIRKQLREMLMNEVVPWKEGDFSHADLQIYIDDALAAIEEAIGRIEAVQDLSQEYGDPEFDFYEGNEIIDNLDAAKQTLEDYAKGAQESAEYDVNQMGARL